MNMKKTARVATIIIVVATLVLSVFIMANGLGLSDELDFGAGSYYYADIPDFEKYMKDGAYSSTLPLWLAIILFLAWGALMYWLWKWIDKRK